MAVPSGDDGFHEIQLNGKQLVFLFMAVTVVSVVIFLCGVLVGRGVAAARADTQALAPAVELEVPPAASNLPLAAAPTDGRPVTANETLSYPDRLGSANPTPEQLRNAEAPPAVSEPTSESGVADEAPSRAPAEPAAADTPVRASVSSEPPGPGFAIQVAALRERRDAEAMAARLSARGFSAYVVPPAAGTPAVYRVRVGKFTDRREAESVAARLEQEEQFKPWIVR